jgi:hypothetical protein
MGIEPWKFHSFCEGLRHYICKLYSPDENVFAQKED